MPAGHKPGEASPYHPPYYMPVQPPPHPGQEHEGSGYSLPPPHQYYPGPYLPYGSMPYPTPYIVPHHRDVQVMIQPHAQYPGYIPNGHHMPFSKPPSSGNAGVDVTVGVNGGTRREDHADGREGLAGIEGRST